ncbi:MAG: nuclear transport factor 2 family protein [Spirosomataceae bacterium]
MKKLFAYLLLGVAGLCWANQQAFAQSEDDAIKATLNNYLDGGTQGDTARLAKAFHPNAIQRYVGTNDGKLKDMPIRIFLSKTPAGGVKRTTRIVSYNYIGNAATAITESVHADAETPFKFLDFLNMLKFGDEWKIVSRVYTRTDLSTELQGTKTSTAVTAKAPPKKTNAAAVKPKADDGW